MRILLLAVVAVLWACAPDPAPPAAPAGAAAPAAPAPADPAAAGPVISDAWVRSVPPAARMTAGYLSVYNPGPEALVIIGVESPLFGSIELHGTVTVDGVARMRHQETVEVPAGEVVRFEPGGLHLMLMQPVDAIPASGTIDLSLVLEDGRRLEFTAPVGQPAG
jgi:periplasmic copper chaperone A